MPKTAFIAIDVQNDYLPSGAVGSPDSDRIIDPLIEYINLAADIVICSRNLRPKDHSSFNQNLPYDPPIRIPRDPIYTPGPEGPWPPNCIKGTYGARIVSSLASIAAKPENYVITKCLERSQGGYSAFEGGTLRPLESLEDILRREEVTHVTIGGYWLEWCVAQTAFDANALGFSTAIEMNCTLPFPDFGQDSSEYATIMEKLTKAGVTCA